MRTAVVGLICSAIIFACSSDSHKGSTITVDDPSLNAILYSKLEEKGIPFEPISETSISVPDDRFSDAWEVLTEALELSPNVAISRTGECLTIEAFAGQKAPHESNIHATSCVDDPDIYATSCVDDPDI